MEAKPIPSLTEELRKHSAEEAPDLTDEAKDEGCWLLRIVTPDGLRRDHLVDYAGDRSSLGEIVNLMGDAARKVTAELLVEAELFRGLTDRLGSTFAENVPRSATVPPRFRD